MAKQVADWATHFATLGIFTAFIFAVAVVSLADLVATQRTRR